MGFFSELKEDLSEAVNQLVSDEELENAEVKEVDATEVLFEKAEADFTEELKEKNEDVFINSFEEASEEAKPVENELDTASVTETEMEVKSSEETVMLDEISDELSIITKNMKVKGDVDVNGSIDLFGTVEGNLKVLGKMNVTGSIIGNAEAAEVYAHGAKISGDVTSYGSVKIGSDSVIRGNIYATSAVVAGAVKGDIDVKGPVILDATAIVMGNIKSKSVQINNGAVIEGLCSQCYAEVSPSSFFGE